LDCHRSGGRGVVCDAPANHVSVQVNRLNAGDEVTHHNEHKHGAGEHHHHESPKKKAKKALWTALVIVVIISMMALIYIYQIQY
jgi:hypothetical protein